MAQSMEGNNASNRDGRMVEMIQSSSDDRKGEENMGPEFEDGGQGWGG